MNVASWLVWGFGATVVLTTLLAVAQGLRLTRMSVPFILGTMVTANRDRARFFGIGMHLVNGWLFGLLYVAIFHVWHAAGLLMGVTIGLVHSLFVLVVALPALPAIHPRMASEERGPTPTRALEPPGFLALHYGYATPVAVVIAHVVYGALLGVLYHNA